MSLCISVVIPEGIVVAGESRQTQVVAGVNRVGSDSVMKVFELADTVLASATGLGFLHPQGTPAQRNIASLVEDFKATIPAGSSVQAIAGLLWTYFSPLYQQHIAQHAGDAPAAGASAISFTVAGYNAGSRVGELYAVDIPSTAAPTTTSRSSNSPGAWWIGQADVVARIINGYDPRVLSLPFVQSANTTGATATTALSGLGYAVFYTVMTLQDAIDFAVGMIQVTITTQRFTAGIATQLGAIAGVGGPIDVAVVRPGGKVEWVRRKELHA